MPTASQTVKLPHPYDWPLLRNLPEIDKEHPLRSMMEMADRLGPMFELKFPGRVMYIASSYALARELCDTKRFEKTLGGPLIEIRALAGRGLFTARNDEPEWGRGHRILRHAFSAGAMKSYYEPMLDLAEQMMLRWERFGETAVHDVAEQMTRLTLDTIALCGFGYRFNSFYHDELDPFIESMVWGLKESGRRSARGDLLNQLFFRADRTFHKHIGLMNQTVDAVIKARKESGIESDDLLGRMLQGVDPETGERLSDEEIRHQIITFLIAGHETTSGLLSFAVYALLKNPEVLAKAVEEVDRVLGPPDRLPRFEEVKQLRYLDLIFRETLRLWPTAPAFSVTPYETTTLANGVTLQPGDNVLVLLPKLHRDPEVWEDPESFKPERFTSERDIPPHAWKPFGNGQRACIGRLFALQEATLVLGMLLQRFSLAFEEDYNLEIKETLTLKPEGLRVRVHRRTDHAPRKAEGPRLAKDELPEVQAHQTPLLVLFGSNAGSAEDLARRLVNEGQSRGWKARMSSMDEAIDSLPTEGMVWIVTASYNGQPPDNAKEFCTWLDQLPKDALHGVRYAVFGCGHRDWATTYQAIPRRVDLAMEAAGAERLVERGEADASVDFFGDFEAWKQKAWPQSEDQLGIRALVDARPLWEVELTEENDQLLGQSHGGAVLTVLENRSLVDMASPLARPKIHLELDVKEKISYKVGDYLSIYPENETGLVQRVASRFALSLDAMVTLHPQRSSATSLPTDRPMPLSRLLGRYVELHHPPTRGQLQQLLELTACPPEQARLRGWMEAYKTEILEPRKSLLEILESLPSCSLSFARFLEMLPVMRPRRYSISSSPKVDAGRCSLTISVLDAPAWSGQGRYRGLASNYLAGLSAGDTVVGVIESPTLPFYPPKDPAIPFAMIAAGTGLAPFRGFLQECEARGEKAEPALLFFGCDHPDVDLLYKDELERWEKEGWMKLFPAYYKAPEGDITFVQHRLWAEREHLKALLEQGGRIYVCGDGRWMAPAVRETVVRILAEMSGESLEEAQESLRQMEQEGRYLADVFA
ncbi:MAG: cytochrome P450 [Myxococcales bacterium]|nr:cytochrome P450 [Myxococcales bacterium]